MFVCMTRYTCAFTKMKLEAVEKRITHQAKHTMRAKALATIFVMILNRLPFLEVFVDFLFENVCEWRLTHDSSVFLRHFSSASETVIASHPDVFEYLDLCYIITWAEMERRACSCQCKTVYSYVNGLISATATATSAAAAGVVDAWLFWTSKFSTVSDRKTIFLLELRFNALCGKSRTNFSFS